ncbi:MAG: endonuclease III [Burkholderiaceae bacterium]
MNAQKRHEIFLRLQTANPEPKTELEYASPFELLVAVLLSAQSTDVSVNKVTRRLFALANTPAGLLALGESRIRQEISSIGLYRNKAANLIKTCEQLLTLHEGEVPEDRDALEALPGVGRKTANVVLNTAFGWETFAVDTHIFRVSNRTGIAPGKTVIEVEKRLERLVPDGFRLHAHHWLILHGRYTCMARKPECPDCLIQDLCEFKRKTKVTDV